LNPVDDKLTYAIYLGYDAGDVIYDNTENLAKIRDWAQEEFKNNKVVSRDNMKMVRIPDKQKLTAIWNTLFTKAYEDKCDYYYSIGDDVKMENAGQMPALVKILQERTVPNFGLVGAADMQLTDISHAEQPVVSSIHYKIFGYMFPPAISDFGSDVWASYIYGPYTHISQDYRVYNTIRSRHAGVNPGDKLKSGVDHGKEKICEWLKGCAFEAGWEMCEAIKTNNNKYEFPTTRLAEDNTRAVSGADLTSARVARAGSVTHHDVSAFSSMDAFNLKLDG